MQRQLGSTADGMLAPHLTLVMSGARRTHVCFTSPNVSLSPVEANRCARAATSLMAAHLGSRIVLQSITAAGSGGGAYVHEDTCQLRVQHTSACLVRRRRRASVIPPGPSSWTSHIRNSKHDDLACYSFCSQDSVMGPACAIVRPEACHGVPRGNYLVVPAPIGCNADRCRCKPSKSDL